jgi:hypothetical protein
MADFTKLATYLESFKKDDAGYDLVCFIKAKIAEDQSDPLTVNNSEDEELGDNDVTMATPEQQSESNAEGELMHGAFRELDALNELDKREEQINVPVKKKSFSSTPELAGGEDFPGMGQAHNQVRKVGSLNKNCSLFDVLQTRLKK